MKGGNSKHQAASSHMRRRRWAAVITLRRVEATDSSRRICARLHAGMPYPKICQMRPPKP